MDSNDKWHELADERLQQAADALADYTPEARRAILAELQSRGLPAPVERQHEPSFFTVATRGEKLFGLFALVTGVGGAALLFAAILGGWDPNFFGVLVTAVLGPVGFMINRAMHRGAPLSNLEAALGSRHVRERATAVSQVRRIEPRGRARALALLAAVAASDPDDGVRRSATDVMAELRARDAAEKPQV